MAMANEHPAFTCTVEPATIDHPLGPEKASVFSDRWSLVRGLHRTTIHVLGM